MGHSQTTEFENRELSLYAAEGGSVELLKWMHSQMQDEDFYYYSEGRGFFNERILGYPGNALYAHQQHCAKAAQQGQLEALKWLVMEAGCPWDKEECKEEAYEGNYSRGDVAQHPHVIEWIDNEAPSDSLNNSVDWRED